MPSWAELQLVLHQLGLIFDGLRDDLLRLCGVVLAAMTLIAHVRKVIRGLRRALWATKTTRSRAKRGKRSRRRRR
jgi:hypothetical protein